MEKFSAVLGNSESVSYAGIKKVEYINKNTAEAMQVDYSHCYELETVEEEIITEVGFIDAIEMDETGKSFTITIHHKID